MVWSSISIEDSDLEFRFVCLRENSFRRASSCRGLDNWSAIDIKGSQQPFRRHFV